MILKTIGFLIYIIVICNVNWLNSLKISLSRENILLLFISVQFYDAWKGLCDWLDDSSKTVTKFMVPVNQGSATKQNIDDLKVNLYVYL